ncbi:lysophospholipase [Flavobacteriaceae bacterium M23B6Z8]
MKQDTFELVIENHKLRGQYWCGRSVSHVIILIHGMGEHYGRYEDFVVPELLRNQAAVIGYDQVGHGKSEGKRGHCSSYEILLDSLELVVKKTTLLFPGKPLFFYAQSMGGNVALNYVLRRQSNVKGVIASSPFLRLAFDPPSWKMMAGKLLQKIAPAFTLPLDLDTQALSKDTIEVKKYEEDPLVHNKVSPNFSFPVMEAGTWAIKNAVNLKTPVLLMHGHLDRIIDHKGSIDFASKSDLVTLRLFPEGYHELHNDLEKKEVLKTVKTWINLQSTP